MFVPGLARFMRLNALKASQRNSKLRAAADGEPLLQREIDLKQPRSAQRIAAGVAPRAARGHGERRDVEPLLRRLRRGIGDHAGHGVRPLAGVVAIGQIARSAVDGDCQRPAGARLHQAGQLPPAEDVLQRAASRSCRFVPKRQLVDAVHRERVADILIRARIFTGSARDVLRRPAIRRRPASPRRRRATTCTARRRGTRR